MDYLVLGNQNRLGSKFSFCFVNIVEPCDELVCGIRVPSYCPDYCPDDDNDNSCRRLGVRVRK